MWRIPEDAGDLRKEPLFSGVYSGDASLAVRPRQGHNSFYPKNMWSPGCNCCRLASQLLCCLRHHRSESSQQLPESSSVSVFWPEDCHETASRFVPTHSSSTHTCKVSCCSDMSCSLSISCLPKSSCATVCCAKSVQACHSNPCALLS